MRLTQLQGTLLAYEGSAVDKSAAKPLHQSAELWAYPTQLTPTPRHPIPSGWGHAIAAVGLRLPRWDAVMDEWGASQGRAE